MINDLLPYLVGINAATSGSTTIVVTVGSLNGLLQLVPSAYPVLPGDTVIVSGGGGTGVPTGVTDTQGHTYTAVQSLATSPANWQFIAHATNGLSSSTPDTITVTYSGTGSAKNVVVTACTGIVTASPVDSPSLATSSGTFTSPSTNPPTVTSGNLAGAGKGEHVLAIISNASGGGSPTFPSVWTVLGTVQGPSNGPFVTVAAKMNSAQTVFNNTNTAPITVGPTLPSSGAWTMAIAAFKPATVPQKALMGATVFQGSFPGSGSDLQASKDFDTTINAPDSDGSDGDTGTGTRVMGLGFRKTYFTEGLWPTSPSQPRPVNTYSNAGIYQLLCFQPTRAKGGGVTSEQANLANAIILYKNFLVQQGPSNGYFSICFFQEGNGGGQTGPFGDGSFHHETYPPGSNNPGTVYGKPGTVTAAQAQTNFLQYWAYYSPIVLQSGIPMIWNSAVYSPDTALTYIPPRSQLNGMITDYYAAGDFTKGVTLGTYNPTAGFLGLASGNLPQSVQGGLTIINTPFTPALPVGLGEIGCNNGHSFPTPTQFDHYLNNQITTPFLNAYNSGATLLFIAWYQQGAGNGSIDPNISPPTLSSADTIIDDIQFMYDTLTNPPATSPVITTTSLPTATRNSAYSTTLTESGGTAPFTWTVTSGAVPGLSIASSTGIYSGTPTTAGNFSVTFKITDTNNNTGTTTLPLLVNQVGTGGGSLTPYVMCQGSASSGTNFISVTVATSNASGDCLMAWTTCNAGKHPVSLSDPVNGGWTPVGSGIVASVAGQWFIMPNAAVIPNTDAIKAVFSSTGQAMTLQVFGCSGVSSASPVDIDVTATNTSTSPTAVSGTLVQSQELVMAGLVNGGAGGNPSWSGSFTLLGTNQNPSGAQWGSVSDDSVAANTSVTATATITSAIWGIQLISVTAAAAVTQPNITTTTLPGATQGQPYTATINVTGGVLPYQPFTVITGALPAGLTLSAAGAITGSPTVNGPFPFTVQVTDNIGQQDTQALLITVVVAVVQQVIGTSTFDYGSANIEIATTTGNTLIVLAGWDLSTSGTSAAMPAVYVNDSEGNYWYHVATSSSGNSGSRSAAWICPNAFGITWLSVATTSFVSSLAYTILEIGSLPTIYQLDVVGVNSNSLASSLTISPGSTSDADFAFAVFTIGSLLGSPSLSSLTSWVPLTPVGASTGIFGGTNSVTIFPYYSVTSQLSSLNTTFTLAQSFPLSGVIFGVHTTVAPPVQLNPNFPVLKVEAAFGFTPGDPSQSPPFWTDITNRCISSEGQTFISISMGREYELAVAESGEMQIGINNYDGAFTPGNSLSPYFPNVVLETPIRVSAFWAGIWYFVGFGYVERWPQEWPDLPQWGISRMIATDAFSVMAATSMSAALDSEILLDAPYAAFPASEQYTTFTNGIDTFFTAANAQGLLAQNISRTNQRAGMYVDGTFTAPIGTTVVINADTGVTTNLLGTSNTGFGTSSITVAPVAPSSGPGIIYTDPNIPDPIVNTGVTVTFWVIIGNNTVSASVQPTLFTAFGSPSNYNSTPSLTVQAINFNGAGTLQITLADGTSFSAVFTPSATLAQQITLEISSGSISVYVNGSLVITQSLTSTQTTVWNAVAFGCPNYAYQSSLNVPGNFTEMECAIYSYLLANQRIEAQWTTGSSGQQGVDAVDRIAQILDWANLGLPRAGRKFFSGVTDDIQQGPAYSLQGAAAADAVNQVAINQNSMVVATPSGAVVYMHLWDLFNQTPEIILGDNTDPTQGEVPYLQPTAWSYDNTYLYNTVQVTLQVGANNLFTATAVNFTSQQEYFARSALTETITTTSNLDAYDLANWQVNKYSQPQLRVSGVTVDAASNPTAAFPVILSIQQGDAITVTRRPVGGAVISQTVLVQKISHEIGPTSWRTTLQLSPYAPEDSVLELDNLNFNILGSGTLA